jgi:hypothetical protein
MQTDAHEIIEGVVLCRVGGDRLAVRAHEVVSFEVAAPGSPYAGTGFDAGARAPSDAKLLRTPTGSVAVDSLEVSTERVRLLPVPRIVSATWGGALAGFVETAGALWPVVSLTRLTAEHPS